MAIYEVEMVLEDEQGRTTNRTVLFDAVDEAALFVDLGTYMPAYQAMTKCGLNKYSYRRSVDVSEAADAGSNIDAGATFLFATALTVDPTVKVPDPVEAIKDGQGGIDLTDLIVTTWFAEYNPGDARVNINTPSQPSSIRRGTLDK